VVAAFKAQKLRNQTKNNANLTPQELHHIAPLNKGLNTVLEQAVRQFKLTARSIDKVIKVARTIADINAHTNIEKEDLLEALSFRRRN
jgi:magnesium chelatase family protein